MVTVTVPVQDLSHGQCAAAAARDLASAQVSDSTLRFRSKSAIIMS